jgi:hypothetical protein
MPSGRGRKRDSSSASSMPSLPTMIVTGPQHVIAQQQKESHTQSSAVILKLSKACKNHLDKHPDLKHTPVRVDSSSDGKVPELCQATIETLKKLLPKVEKVIRPPKQGQEGPSAIDVAHLCDYYKSVIRGVFCPHAANLFDRGKGGLEG